MTTGKLCDDRIARPRAAFDAYATDYTAGMENPLKAVLGAPRHLSQLTIR